MSTATLSRPREAKESRLPDERFEEVWEGVVFVPPVPNYLHQFLADDLLRWLSSHWADPIRARVVSPCNLTTPEDEDDWMQNYRNPDLLLIPRERFHILKGTYLVGGPLAVVEILSMGDRTYEKFDFYAGIGTDEFWVISNATRKPEIYVLHAGKYDKVCPDEDGWLRSPATGVCLKHWNGEFLRVRMRDDHGTISDLPKD